jgi:integrase
MGRKRSAKHRGFPPNLYLNAAGYFYFVRPGDKKVKGLGRDKANAFTQARAANAALAVNVKDSLADWVLGKAEYTLAEWLPVYMRLWIEQSPKEPAANTLRNCTAYLKKATESDYAWRRLSEIETAHIAPHIAAIARDSGAAAAVAYRVRLRDAFRMAETQGLIGVGRNPVSATYTPDRTVKRERLSIEDFIRIREAAPTFLRNAMNLAIVSGQRREDLSNLLFQDYRDGHLHVTQGKSQGKTRLRLDGRIRLQAVGLTLAEAIQNCRDAVVSRYLIHHTEHLGSAKPGDKISIGGLTNVFARVRDQVGIVATPGRTPPSFHEIRSLAERLYREQYGADFAQSILGHKHASTTAIYDDMRGQGWEVVTAGNL